MNKAVGPTCGQVWWLPAGVCGPLQQFQESEALIEFKAGYLVLAFKGKSNKSNKYNKHTHTHTYSSMSTSQTTCAEKSKTLATSDDAFFVACLLTFSVIALLLLLLSYFFCFCLRANLFSVLHCDFF